MDKFRPGNVVKLNASSDRAYLVIVVRQEGVPREKAHIKAYRPGVSWVSFGSEASSGFTPLETYQEEKECPCSMHYIDPECETCKGTGVYMETRNGMDKAVVLASCVKDYIIRRLLQNFDF